MPITNQDVELLLVEDQHDQARFVERLIHEQQSSLNSQTTHSPIEVTDIHYVDTLSSALEYLDATSPDAILLDLMLPDSRGIETVDRVIEYAPDVPVVVLTGQNETDVGVDAVQRGAQEYLSKGSVTGETILRTLRYAIERSRNQRKLVDRNHRLALLNQILRQDVRADLSMIVGLGDQLEGDGSDDDERTRASLLDVAQHAADRTDTAAAVVDVISADDLNREPCDLYAVLETEVSQLRHEREIDITIERTNAVDGKLLVSATPMLGSVFKHLFEKAADRSDRAIPRVTVTVETTSTEAKVEIADDGGEIPGIEREVLVDPDVRFDTRSGLDLKYYLVMTVLNSFGASLEIDANDPCGSCVTVLLARESASHNQS